MIHKKNPEKRKHRKQQNSGIMWNYVELFDPPFDPHLTPNQMELCGIMLELCGIMWNYVELCGIMLNNLQIF